MINEVYCNNKVQEIVIIKIQKRKGSYGGLWQFVEVLQGK